MTQGKLRKVAATKGNKNNGLILRENIESTEKTKKTPLKGFFFVK
jgi:hypothetical protein